MKSSAFTEAGNRVRDGNRVRTKRYVDAEYAHMHMCICRCHSIQSLVKLDSFPGILDCALGSLLIKVEDTGSETLEL